MIPTIPRTTMTPRAMLQTALPDRRGARRARARALPRLYLPFLPALAITGVRLVAGAAAARAARARFAGREHGPASGEEHRGGDEQKPAWALPPLGRKAQRRAVVGNDRTVRMAGAAHAFDVRDLPSRFV